jgi:hypothetical protein
MSVLLIGLGKELTPVLVTRLVAEDDEVRVLERNEDVTNEWRDLGAHIAGGPRWDADLIERAAQNVRTIVVGEAHDEDPRELMEAVVGGGGFASRTMRIVLIGEPGEAVLDIVRASSLEHVVLGVARRGLLGRKPAIDPSQIAEAIDAADDLAGNPHLELDLATPDAWRTLRLVPPSERP